jgi:hypothetical protein
MGVVSGDGFDFGGRSVYGTLTFFRGLQYKMELEEKAGITREKKYTRQKQVAFVRD